VATKKGVTRKDLKNAQSLVDKMRDNLKQALPEDVKYWTDELHMASNELDRITRELEEAQKRQVPVSRRPLLCLRNAGQDPERPWPLWAPPE
jgi:hypothetical protein